MHKLQLIDTHCHLYLSEFAGDFPEMMRRAIEDGVSDFVLPAIDNSHLESMFSIEKQDSFHFHLMIGLHPCSVQANYTDELDGVKIWLDTRPFAAIGEIGLDYHWDKTFAKQQIEAFRLQIEWALLYNLPIVIHSRDAIDDCMKIVQEYIPRGLTGIFHCFSGNREQAFSIAALGFLLGIGGVLTYKNSGLSEAIKDIPLESIVLETDAPYLSPVPFRGKRNESSYLRIVCRKLAEVKGIEEEKVASITTANAQKIFRI